MATTATNVVTVGLGCSIILQLILQKVIKKVWPLFNALQLIFLFLIYSLLIPGNVNMVLSRLKSAMELGLGDAAPIELDTSALKVPKFEPMDFALYIGLPVIIVLTALIYGLFKCLKKCDKLRGILMGLVNSVFLNGIMRTIFCLYLVLCAKSDID
jgi:hypothetical protein